MPNYGVPHVGMCVYKQHAERAQRFAEIITAIYGKLQQINAEFIEFL